MKKSYLGVLKDVERSLEKSWNEYSRKAFRLLFRFSYPKLAILGIMAAFAYLIFSQPEIEEHFSGIGNLAYFGSFLSGLLFSFGFTTPFAIGAFLSLDAENVLLAALIGGIGAMISDFIIFVFIKASFIDEFEKIKKTKAARIFSEIIEKGLPNRLKHYLLFALAGLIISSPLPDEIGVIMLAGLSTIRPWTLGVISFTFNTLGILILLVI